VLPEAPLWLKAVLATAVVYASFSAVRLAGWLVTDRGKVRRVEEEVRAWEERRRRALEARDVKLLERLRREQRRIERLKREAELERMKAWAAAFVAWFAILHFLGATGNLALEIVLPAPWGYVRSPLATWFIVSSLWSNALLERLASLLRLARPK